MSILYTNRAKAQLARTITASDTTLSVLSGTGDLFPTITQSGDFFPVTLVSVSSGGQYEIAYCIARNGDTMALIRGREGTTPVAFQSGDIVSLNMTSAAYRRLPQAGYLGQFSQEVANSPDGYRKGAIVCDGTPGIYWISLIDQNTTAPNANNQTWRKLDTNGLLHPPDISGLVSGSALNGTAYQNDFTVSNVGVNKANGTPWFYSPNGGGVINLALQSALQQEVQRAQAAEAGLLPLAGGTITGPINRAGGGVLPEVLGLNGRAAIQSFTVKIQSPPPPRGNPPPFFSISFPTPFRQTPQVFFSIDWEIETNSNSPRTVNIGPGNSDGSNSNVTPTGCNLCITYTRWADSDVQTTNSPITSLNVLAIGVI